MAHFRGTLLGNRGEASRLGSAKSGIQASVNGRNVGVNVVADVDPDTGKDVVTVLPTSGSYRGQDVDVIWNGKYLVIREK